MAHKNQILIIDPASHTPELDSFNHIASMSSLPCSYHLTTLYGMGSLRMIPEEKIKGIILLGSSASVYDNLTWQAKFNPWLLNHLKKGTPTLGICYGHQLIAHLLGASIRFYKTDKKKLKGTRNLQFHNDPRLPIKQNYDLIVSHNEVVTSIPKNMAIWASSSEVRIDGLYHITLPIWSLQPHPEATMEFIKHQEISFSNTEKELEEGYKLVNEFCKFCAS